MLAYDSTDRSRVEHSPLLGRANTLQVRVWFEIRW